MLMVNDRRLNADTFWFTLFYKIGHINNGDLGIAPEERTHHAEDEADIFAEDKLIPSDAYQQLLRECDHHLTLQDILRFASLQRKYKICTRI